MVSKMNSLFSISSVEKSRVPLGMDGFEIIRSKIKDKNKKDQGILKREGEMGRWRGGDLHKINRVMPWHDPIG
jgi:hypothetical protein